MFSTAVVLQQIATDMYSRDLISQPTKDVPTFQGVMKEFESGMHFIGKRHRLVKHCQLFLQILLDQRGPHKQAAIRLAEDWTDNIERQLHIAIDFDIDSN